MATWTMRVVTEVHAQTKAYAVPHVPTPTILAVTACDYRGTENGCVQKVVEVGVCEVEVRGRAVETHTHTSGSRQRRIEGKKRRLRKALSATRSEFIM